MSDHVVLYVERLKKPESVEEEAAREGSGGGAGPSVNGDDVEVGEDQPLIQVGECRICQEEDSVDNLETPCACSGSLKYAHRKCVQHWCNEKGDITCEICHQQYQPNYTEPPPPPRLEDTAIEIGGGWTISGTSLDLQDPRLLAIAEAERHFLEAEYDASNGGASFFRSAALILIALLLLRHALAIPDADGEEDVATFVSLFVLRVAGFLLPCYIIIAWAINTLLRPRQRQEEAAAALAATQVAIVLQSGERGGLQFTIASGSNNRAAQPQESQSRQPYQIPLYIHLPRHLEGSSSKLAQQWRTEARWKYPN